MPTKKTDTKAKTKPKGKAQVKAKTRKTNEKEYILVDEKAGLIFESEKDLFGYFESHIAQLEDEYASLRAPEDFSDDEQLELEHYLENALDEPDEVWMDETTFGDIGVYHFIKNVEEADSVFKYVACAYVSTENEFPTFVFIHFPTKDSRLWQNYQRGDLVYDKRYEEVSGGGIEGDALLEGDSLAMGLYQAMLKVRGEKDIHQDQFQDFADLREETIEAADEIWRKNDLDGHVLVSFIKDFPDHESLNDLSYVAVTLEEPDSSMHSLLFSFPTTDKTLVDRYRQGENLQAEEVSQENSH